MKKPKDIVQFEFIGIEPERAKKLEELMKKKIKQELEKVHGKYEEKP